MPNQLLNVTYIDIPSYLALLVVAGFALGMYPRLDLFLRPVTTYLHEMGHAFTAILLGRQVTRIKVKFWFGGHTDYVGPKGMGNILISWNGYGSPAFLSLGVIAAVLSGQAFLIFATFALASILAALLQRTLTGLFSTAIYSGLLLISALNFEIIWIQALSLFMIGVLNGHGFTTVKKLQAVRIEIPTHFEYDKEVSDSEILERWTRIPAQAWETSWLISLILSCVALIVVTLI